MTDESINSMDYIYENLRRDMPKFSNIDRVFIKKDEPLRKKITDGLPLPKDLLGGWLDGQANHDRE